MHETSAIPIRKAPGLTACRSSHVCVNIGANNNNNPFQRLRWLETRQGLQGWLLEIGALNWKFDDIHGFAGLYQFRYLQRKLGHEFPCYQILLVKCATYIRPRVDLGVPPILAIAMARNTQHPRLFKDGCWKHSPTNSMIFVDLRVSTNFSVSNGTLRLDFLLPTSAY